MYFLRKFYFSWIISITVKSYSEFSNMLKYLTFQWLHFLSFLITWRIFYVCAFVHLYVSLCKCIFSRKSHHNFYLIYYSWENIKYCDLPVCLFSFFCLIFTNISVLLLFSEFIEAYFFLIDISSLFFFSI